VGGPCRGASFGRRRGVVALERRPHRDIPIRRQSRRVGHGLLKPRSVGAFFAQVESAPTRQGHHNDGPGLDTTRVWYLGDSQRSALWSTRNSIRESRRSTEKDASGPVGTDRRVARWGNSRRVRSFNTTVSIQTTPQQDKTPPTSPCRSHPPQRLKFLLECRR
jgi:hypothetical protein